MEAANPDKPDFPGILPQGFRVCSLGELREHCVVPFELSETRPQLMDNFCELVRRIEEVELESDLWVDGSFATKKLNPNDIDIVARIPGSCYNEPLDSMVGQFLEWLSSGEPREELILDVYEFPDYPIESSDREITEERLRYWISWFSTGRDPNSEKGIFVVKTCGGVT